MSSVTLPNGDRAVVDIAKLRDHDIEEQLWDTVGRLFVDDFIAICGRSELLDREDSRR